ncbi:hypothetical protein Trichorick_01300 [Candidatus Trichorickettsia mobilis]|uniref:Uncharacterized protein n=1 Tax=Candidatus Trichorickettsia mobilis TaxID=1346319 RepID=A0ABZ0UWU2_9RICK|nr:hypothetical protein Trichorick_01300 [Candidatus Trichorickettsia mobilis]
MNSNILFIDRLIERKKAFNVSGIKLPKIRQLKITIVNLTGKLKRTFL